MTKEEFTRESAQGPISSIPPRGVTSESARPLPSTPPSTEDIDTDWGDPEPSPVIASLRTLNAPSTQASPNLESAEPSALTAETAAATAEADAPTAEADAPTAEASAPTAEASASTAEASASTETPDAVAPSAEATANIQAPLVAAAVELASGPGAAPGGSPAAETKPEATVATRPSSVPPPPPKRISSVPPAPASATPQPDAAPAAVRAPRQRAATLIGIAPLIERPSQIPTERPEANAAEGAETSAVAPPAATDTQGVAVRGGRARPVLAQTLIGGLAAPTPSPTPTPSPVAIAPDAAADGTQFTASRSTPQAELSAPPTTTREKPRGAGAETRGTSANASGKTAAAAPDAQLALDNSGFRRWLVVLAAAMVVVCAVAYRVLRPPRAGSTTSISAALPREQEPRAMATAASAASAVAPTVNASADTVRSAAPNAPATNEPAATGEPGASAEAEGITAAESSKPSKPGTYRVLIKSIPPKARFFRFGKQVGVTPFVLELPVGERRSYEAGLPGHITRKVVVDGSKPEITVGLRDQ